MRAVVRAAAYLIGAWISQKYAAGYWVTGPVFGLVVLIWDSEMPGDIFRLKNVPFLTASTLVYACVFWIASRDFGYNSTFWEIFTGSSSWGVLLGSLLMPQAHRIFLGNGSRVRAASIQLVISFYLVTGVSKIAEHFSLGSGVNFIGIAVFVWQGIYLANFYLVRGADRSGGRLRLMFD